LDLQFSVAYPSTGDIIKEYQAPENGIVIGKSVSPVNQAGGRILHLGIMKKE